MNTYKDYFEFIAEKANSYKKLSVMIQLQRYKSDLEAKGHQVYAIMLKGSQNYNLHDSESDVDANAILIPSLSEIRHKKSYKYTYDTGEVTCHNIYSFADIVAKGNPQWIEVCNTPYLIGGSLELFKHFKVNPSALKGMFYEKVEAFDKLYPSRAHMIEKFGYDPKQLHHIIRLYHTLKGTLPYSIYTGAGREWMLGIKRGSLNKADAQILMDKYIQKLLAIYESRKLAYSPQTVDYDAIDNIVLNYYLTTLRP